MNSLRVLRSLRSRCSLFSSHLNCSSFFLHPVAYEAFERMTVALCADHSAQSGDERGVVGILTHMDIVDYRVGILGRNDMQTGAKLLGKSAEKHLSAEDIEQITACPHRVYQFYKVAYGRRPRNVVFLARAA